MSTTTYLDQFLDPLAATFSPEVARRIIDLRAPLEIQARATVLADKANLGTLSAEEEAEYKDFVDAVDIIAILQTKARKFLTQRGS